MAEDDTAAVSHEEEGSSRRLKGASASASNIESKYPTDLLLTKPYRADPNRFYKVVLHVIGIGYMLLGLNTVCDVYFTGALEEMVDNWDVQEDVAGATFMAAGGSAPEFFTSLVGVTIADNDVGFSTIVGSAVFNVLFVIGLCGFVAPGDMDLTWWPLFRDCTFYMIGLSVLAGFASDQQIELWEAILLFLLYLIYLVIMRFNPQLQEMAQSFVNKNKVVDMDSSDSGARDAWTEPKQPVAAAPVDKPAEVKATSIGKEDVVDIEEADDAKAPAPPRAAPEAPPEATPEATPESDVQDVEKQDTEDDDDEGDFIDMPEGTIDRIIWAISLPVYVPLWYLTPLPSSDGDEVKKRFGVPVFLITFMVSLLWIAGFAFCSVWWVEILGEVLHVDEIIMGFTILAAGTSIPDAVSSMAVARAGHGDMAVSSSIGSNIFDILIGLPIPWIIRTGIMDGNKALAFKSEFLTFYVILLLGMVLTTTLCIHCLGWKLNKPLGVAMTVFYVAFLAIAMVVEFTDPDALKLHEN
jgi:sodium/potassium/calcium exchanger 2